MYALFCTRRLYLCKKIAFVRFDFTVKLSFCEWMVFLCQFMFIFAVHFKSIL